MRTNFAETLLWQLVLAVTLAAVATVGYGQQVSEDDKRDVFASVALPGQSKTLLPNGQWLLLGGEAKGSPTSVVQVYDAATPATLLLSSMGAPRAGHTATVLPDGRVLILGGTGVDNRIVESVQVFDPATATFVELQIAGVTPRTEHTATLLTDGRILVAGGISASGQVQRDAQLIDTLTWQVETLDAELDAPRFGHLAALMPASSVLLWGGFGSANQPLTSALLFAPGLEQFFPIPPLEVADALARLSEPGAPAVTGAIPPSGAIDVAIDGRLSVRFSTPLQPPSLNAETVVLYGPAGVVSTKVVPTEGGLLLFITPAQDLFPGSQYTLFLSGAVDANGERLPLSAISFRTASIAPSTLHPTRPATQLPTGDRNGGSNNSNGSGMVVANETTAAAAASAAPDAQSPDRNKVAPSTDDDEEWIPGPAQFHGDWRAHRKPPQLSKAKPPVASAGVTALSGLVLRLNGIPLANVTLSVGSRSAKTDADGFFLLTDIPAGKQTLTIDGVTANRTDASYGLFESVVEVRAGQTNELPYTIWMPKLDTQHTIKIPSPTTEEVVLTTPRIPGFEVHLPKGVVIRDRAGHIVTEVGITAVPLDRTPFPQPFMDFPVYYTVQPGGAFIQGLDGTKVESARLVYPNYTQLPPGQRADFWLYDPVEKGWYVYGQGAVTADGTRVLPDKGVGLYEFTGGGYSGGSAPVGPGPPPCAADACCGGPAGGPPGDDQGGGGSWKGGGDVGDPACGNTGDPVNLATGLFVQTERDLAIKDVVPLSVLRVYRQNNDLVGTFGKGTSTPYDMYLYTSNPSTFPDLILVLADGGQVKYPRTSGSGITDGVYQHFGSPSPFYGSKIQLGGTGSHLDYVLTMVDGRKFVFYHHLGKLVSFSDRLGNTTTINRPIDGNGNPGAIASIVGPTGRTITFSTNPADGTVNTVMDALGRMFSYTYINQYLSTVSDPEGGVRHYTYDANNRLWKVQDPNGNVSGATRVTIEYDANGRVYRETFADGSTMLFTYTLSGGSVTQTSVTDQRGNVRQVAFNSLGYVTSSTYPVGKPEVQTTTFTRDLTSGLLTTKTDALGRNTGYTYDSFGKLKTVTLLQGTANAVTTTYNYEPTFHQLSSVTDPLGHTWQYTFDSLGNRTAAIDPLGNTTVLGYDGHGKITSVTDALGHTTSAVFDGSDLISITDPLSRTTTLSYDAVGRPFKMVSPMGHVTQARYDNLNRLKQVTDPLSFPVNLGYDANGNLLSSQDQNANPPTNYSYNNLSRRYIKTDALTHQDTTLYDVAGKFMQFTDRKGQVAGASYDNANRVQQIGFGATAVHPTAYQSTIGYTYDAGNRVTDIVDSLSGTVHRNYDGLNRLILEQTPQGSVTYAYYASGMRQTMTVASQPTVTYTYDNANRLTQIQSGTGGSGLGTVGLAYDAANRRQTATLPNGVLITYNYDNANQLTGLAYTKGTTTVGTLTYGYDADGRRNSVGGTLAQIVLPQAVASTSYNANNQMLQWGSQSYSYDLNGNITGDGSKTFTWDSRDQLTALSGSVTAGFGYDGFGRRISKSIGMTATGYLYDGLSLVQELTGTSPKANLLTGRLIDEVFLRNQSGTASNVLADALGSVIGLTDGNGSITSSYAYEPYGATTQAGASNENSQQFTGRENDGTGLMYYRARYYIPNCGRFAAEDPIGIVGGLNKYQYANGGPSNVRDPLGLFGYGFPWGPQPGPVAPATPPQSQGAPCGAASGVRGPDFVAFEVDAYVASAWGIFSRDGDSFVGGGVNYSAPNPLGTNASAVAGWLNSPSVAPGQTNDFLAGYGGGATMAYAGIGGGLMWGSDGSTATVFGVGGGAKPMGTPASPVTATFGLSSNQGNTGICW